MGEKGVGTLSPEDAHRLLDELGVGRIRLRKLASAGLLIPRCAITCVCKADHCVWPGGPTDFAPLVWRERRPTVRNIMTDEHIIPRSRGGDDSLANTRVAHYHCQLHQAGCLSKEFLLKAIADPAFVAHRTARYKEAIHNNPEWLADLRAKARVMARSPIKIERQRVWASSPENLARIATLRSKEASQRGGFTQGRSQDNMEHLARLNADPALRAQRPQQLAKARCQNHRINKGKPCYCGQH